MCLWHGSPCNHWVNTQSLKTNGRLTQQARLQHSVWQQADHRVQALHFCRDCIHSGVSAQKNMQQYRWILQFTAVFAGIPQRLYSRFVVCVESYTKKYTFLSIVRYSQSILCIPIVIVGIYKKNLDGTSLDLGGVKSFQISQTFGIPLKADLGS